MKDYIIPILVAIIFLMAYWIDCQRKFIKQLEEYRKKDHEFEDYQSKIIEQLTNNK